MRSCAKVAPASPKLTQSATVASRTAGHKTGRRVQINGGIRDRHILAVAGKGAQAGQIDRLGRFGQKDDMDLVAVDRTLRLVGVGLQHGFELRKADDKQGRLEAKALQHGLVDLAFQIRNTRIDEDGVAALHMGIDIFQPEFGQHLAEFGHGQAIGPSHIDPAQQEYLSIGHIGSRLARKGEIFASSGASVPVMF